MARTVRREGSWYRHEHPTIRRNYNKRMRLLNRQRVRKGMEPIPIFKTRGWLTW